MEKYTKEVTDDKIINILTETNETYIPEINEETTAGIDIPSEKALTDIKTEDKEIQPTEEKPKRKRGRPRKGEEVNKEIKDKTQVNNQNTGTIDLSQYQPTDIPQDQMQATVNVANYVSGGLLLIMIDTIVPEILKLVMPKLKNLKNRSAIKLTKDEREELKPLADEVIKSLSLQMSPLEGLLFAMSFIYAGKVFTLDESDYKTIVKPVK